MRIFFVTTIPLDWECIFQLPFSHISRQNVRGLKNRTKLESRFFLLSFAFIPKSRKISAKINTRSSGDYFVLFRIQSSFFLIPFLSFHSWDTHIHISKSFREYLVLSWVLLCSQNTYGGSFLSRVPLSSFVCVALNQKRSVFVCCVITVLCRYIYPSSLAVIVLCVCMSVHSPGEWWLHIWHG